MKNLQSRMEDKLRIFSNYLDYSLHKSRTLFLKKPALTNVKNILVIELKRIGDIIVSTPTLRALKQNFPNSNIDIIVPKGMEEVLYKNPHLNKILTWDRYKLKENYNFYLEEIKDKYDLAVILHNGTFLISKLLKEAHIPYRIGCTRVGFREPKGYFLTKQLLPDKNLKHKIEDNLDVLKLINIFSSDIKPEIYLSKEAQIWAKTELKKKNVSDKDFLITIQLLSQTHPTWFKDRFAELADKLTEKYKAKILFLGTLDQKDFILEVQNLMKQKSYWLGQTTVQGLFALVQRADLVIGIDSAATNIASALDKNVIALFGAGDKTIWHPVNKNSISLQKEEVCTACMKSFCKYKNSKHLECMKAISVEDALTAVEKLI